MRMIAGLVLTTFCLFLALPALAADSPEESAIKARQGHMEIRAFSLGPLVAMVKRDIEYDADMADRLANDLQAMLDMSWEPLWISQTSTDDFPDQTDALPAIWQADSEFTGHEQSYADAVNELAAVAADGLDALAPAVKDVAQACKACHDDYRED